MIVDCIYEVLSNQWPLKALYDYCLTSTQTIHAHIIKPMGASTTQGDSQLVVSSQGEEASRSAPTLS